ncbi:MAG: Sulfite reductase [NADPH] flavoprotein alpha-component [Chlamydiia bacterium]|nr:Sulfite reductase [NADPH] flavoprotein alpha-component [Chlamydiia bacterium]MCH9616499.1 Sulfite reductase [NADPH] flavoprotein alpha-component [Chlamydiia bacterium]MCH9629515.1 Sulfite reductase [NADPH] flavoprotein alpha-component [Chlamydiia bacterium]
MTKDGGLYALETHPEMNSAQKPATKNTRITTPYGHYTSGTPMIVNRETPYKAKLLERKCLNKKGSSKTTFFITLGLEGRPFAYKPGDCIGVLPENDPGLVAEIIELTGLTDLRESLALKVNLMRVTTRFLENVLGLELEKEERLHYLKHLDVLDCVKKHKVKQPELFIESLGSLLPRFYSIASSDPDRIDLLIASFSYPHGEEVRKGVASDFLCHRAKDTALIYPHPTKHFLLPESTDTPIIMVGPGTGVAPYRAFLQERQAGKNWLFFGERNQETDFYFEDFFKNHPSLRLSAAFSRDQEEKCYVQHKMLEHKEELWEWIKQGAHIYICGDAKQMARDVTRALEEIIQDDDPKAFLKTLRREKRLLLDVY